MAKLRGGQPQAAKFIRATITVALAWIAGVNFSQAVRAQSAPAASIASVPQVAPALPPVSPLRFASTLTPTFASRVAPGCVLAVSVLDEPQLTGDFPVDEKGVHFRLTDDDGGNAQNWAVPIAAMTVEQAREAIIRSFRKYLREPKVQVQIKTLPYLRVDVSGPVKKEGRWAMPPGAHLSELLRECEPTPDADLANVRVLRRYQPDPKADPTRMTLAVNFQAWLRGKSDDDPALAPQDRILIPTRPNAKPLPPKSVPQFVHVHGSVEHEADVLFSPGLTVREALNRVGGVQASAAHGKIGLGRTKGDYLTLDTDKTMDGDADQNVLLQPDDLLIVLPGRPAEHYAVMGIVVAPGTFDIKPGEKITVATAILAAKGPGKNADINHCVLSQGYLNDPTRARNLPFDLAAVAKGKQPNMQIWPGDALIIPPKQHKPTFWQRVLPIVGRFLLPLPL